MVGVLAIIIAAIQIFSFDFSNTLNTALPLIICSMVVIPVMVFLSIPSGDDRTWDWEENAIGGLGIMGFCFFNSIDVRYLMDGSTFIGLYGSGYTPKDYVLAPLNFYWDLLMLLLLLLNMIVVMVASAAGGGVSDGSNNSRLP